MFKVKMFLCACICILAVPATVARSDDIEVRNPRRDQSITLSDFIVYGEDPKKQKKVIRAPDDPSDDTVIPGWGTRRFTTDFEIKKYIISSCSIDEGHYVEHETVVFEIEKIVPKKLASIEFRPYLQEQFKAILEIDQSIAPEPPPEGTILAFVDGYNELMPGWFVGTGINFDTGEVTGAYTGSIVLEAPFAVMVFTPPYPPDGAVDIPLNAKLYWPVSEEADGYDVYFGTDRDAVANANPGSPEYKGQWIGAEYWYEPWGLEPCTNYCWRVDRVIEEIDEPPDEWPDVPDPNKPPDDEPDPNKPKPPPWPPVPLPDPNELPDEPVPLPPPDPNQPPIIEMLSITTDIVGYEIVKGPVWSFTTGPAKATNPHPIHCATDVDPNAILSWTPGCFAAFEDVYFGTDFYAVANADTSDMNGIYRGRQDANSYDPGGLEVCTAYYWRTDGVEDDDTIHTGDIWSFTTGLAAPAKADSIIVKNKSLSPETLSGLIVYGKDNQQKVILRPNDSTDDVKCGPDDIDQLSYDLAYAIENYIISLPYKDSEGNYTEHTTSVLRVKKNVPKKLACIEIGPYIQEQLKAILEIDQSVAPEPPPEGTILAFVGGQNPQMPGWFVGTDINFDTGEVTGAYTGDVEVLSMAFEVMVFTPPYPPDGAVDIPLNAKLYWPVSEEADGYDVYFGTDRDAVANANPGSPEHKGQWIGTEWFQPYGLRLGTPYFWRTDGVEADGTIHTGDVWSFTTVNDLVMDDFELYNNLPPDDPNRNRIFEIWKDGYGYGDVELGYPGNGTGSMVDISTDVIHEGTQSMRFDYDNSGSYRKDFYSETERTFDTGQDWTTEGVEALSLWFRGDPNNDAEPMYVALESRLIRDDSYPDFLSAVVYHDNLDAVRIDTWTEWFIPLQDFADQGVNLTDVNSIAIGFGTKGNVTIPGGKGKMYFDDIRLCPSR